MTDSADVVVLGLGPGGEDVAGRLADAGLDVVGIEGRLVGGECPYWGCVPSKMMIRAANLLAEGRRIPGMAGQSTVTAEWAPVATRIRDEATDDWDDRVAVERLERKGARFVRGWGRLDGPGRVVVGDRVFEASRGVVVNTGTKAFVPPIAGLAGHPLLDQPRGDRGRGGPRLAPRARGRRHRGRTRPGLRPLRCVGIDRGGSGPFAAPEEPEAGRLLAEVFGREGIAVRTSTHVTAVRHDGERFEVEMDTGARLTAARLLVATGRHVDLGAIGAATVGVDESGRLLPVDDHLRVVRRGVGHRRHHGQGRLHPHVDVPGRHRRATTSWDSRSSRPTTGRCRG